MNSTKLKKCKQERRDCFACDNKGCCVCLNDTDFPYPCPFFKTEAEAGTNAEILKHMF